ncbi:fragile X mental retardation protein, partial [Paragonimus westermani]
MSLNCASVVQSTGPHWPCPPAQAAAGNAMDVGIPVEVEGTYGEFYPVGVCKFFLFSQGIVCDLISAEGYRVKLLDSSHSTFVAEITLPPTAMRLPPDLTSFPFDPIQGQEVDVLIPCVPATETNHDSESGAASPVSRLSAWWPGRVKKVGGSFVIVELASTVATDPSTTNSACATVETANGRINIPPPSSIEKTDIVEKHQLRPRSHQTNFTADSFHMHPIDIPDELEVYCRDPANYQHFARRCGFPVLVCMAPDALKPRIPVTSNGNDTYELKARLLVISTDISTVKRAAVIDNTFIDMLRQKVLILQQTEELYLKLEASRISQTLEAVKQAKALLDYRTEVVPVPRTYVGPIVGSGQRHIQHIVDCVGLCGLKICDMAEPDMEDYVAFQSTGTSQAIRDARMFLEFHVASLQDLDRLRGVKNPPSIPPRKVTIEQDTPAEEPEGSGDTPTVARLNRKSGRSTQRARRRPPPTVQQNAVSNGDAGTSNTELNGRDQPANEPTVDQPNGVVSQTPRHDASAGTAARGNPRSRQRRPQYMQSNNSTS